MKYIPILFSTPMVQAIDADRKTQTRRLKGLEKVNKSPEDFVLDSLYYSKMLSPSNSRKSLVNYFFVFKNIKTNEILNLQCPYGQPGDVLWVRESFYEPLFEKLNGKYYYKAILEQQGWDFKWKPSIHMPKKAARLFLQIKDIRVERLMDISDKDAIAEGIHFEIIDGITEYKNYTSKVEVFSSFNDHSYPLLPTLSFMSLWESINGKESLDLDPWVWVIEFEKIEKPDGFLT